MSRLLIFCHRLAVFLHKLHVPLLPVLITKVFIRVVFGCQISVQTQLGKNVSLGYGGLAVVLHQRAVIGDNVSIGTCVTIGGTTKKYEVPSIGENTLISSGAKILGPITIGRNCVIGANAVVLKDIPDNCVAVGIPAKVVKTDIEIGDYRDV